MVVSYLKDFVCPFSRNTFSTLAMGGTQRSPREKADGWEGDEKFVENVLMNKKLIAVNSMSVFFCFRFSLVSLFCKFTLSLTGNRGAPFTQTLSANRTLLGRVLNLAFLPADRNVDFLPIVPAIDGWHTTSVTFDSQLRTN